MEIESTDQKSNSGYVDLPINATKVESFEDIKKAKRLFYHEVFNHNIPTGNWIEIYDVQKFVEEDEYHQKNNIRKNCLDKSYIEHHNFHVIF